MLIEFSLDPVCSLPILPHTNALNENIFGSVSLQCSFVYLNSLIYIIIFKQMSICDVYWGNEYESYFCILLCKNELIRLCDSDWKLGKVLSIVDKIEMILYTLCTCNQVCIISLG